MTDNKRNRKTRDEMLAFRLAQVAKLEAQIEGSYQDDHENDTLKSLKNRLRKTQTALRAAGVILNGIVKEDGKGWQRAPQAEKIEGTRKRLADQEKALQRAELVSATLPFDVDILNVSITAIEAGDTEVEFPTGLHSLNGAEPKTDEEVEADFIAKEEVTEA